MRQWFIWLMTAATILFIPLSVSAQRDNENEMNMSNELEITVGTYNIQAGMNNDGKYDLDSTAETIRKSGADIIGLNEVDVHWGSRSEFDNVVKILANKLGMEYFFAPIYNLDPSNPEDPNRQYGVAILSKYPIVHAENHYMTRLSTQDPDPSPQLMPGFLQAQIHINGADVWFYVTHLDYRKDPYIREMQVEEMLGIISEHDHNILVGDMNAEPDAPELAPLFQTFQDAWASIHDSPGYTFPADDPVKRIDNVLLSPDIEIQSSQVIESLASDHFPVVANLILTPEEHPFNASGMKKLVDYLLDNGEFTNNESALALKIHLTSVSYYEQKAQANKVVKHMIGFKRLLEHQQAEKVISDDAYEILKTDADYLLNKWQ
ncbi:MAG TPA: endonuclease/exonuclease/phosphatase family protein [Bacillota bacterium]|nr:endonuclease/exonuclease/phosphatase family protein [Bacillota bacterium]